MRRMNTIQRARLLTLGGPFLIIIVLAAGIAFDLAARGPFYHTLERLTGEDAPLAQLRGAAELLGNLTRAQPETAPMMPIAHAGVNPYGVNTFLEQEVEPAKRERQMQMIADAGFSWIRQQFVWQDIEIAGRGDFTDRRNDLDGDGQPDAVDAWAKYDQIVDLAEQYGVQIMARLDNPPEWAQADSGIVGDFAPPADFDDLAAFASVVAQRYRGRIHNYQVWNEPNIFPEWGEQAVSPEAYTDMLCRTYAALKAVDPTIVVISGALSPTLALTGRDLNDFIFLQRMYDAGAGDCFDVLSVQGYGFFSGATDQRMRPFTLTFARNLYIRDLMVANGDADKAIWISEVAWNPIDAPDVPPDVARPAAYGIVTQEQAARYMTQAYARAEQEWPWIGVINAWYFKPASDNGRTDSAYYFRMVEPDFTPLPVYASVRQYIRSTAPTLYAGVHQHDDWALTLTDAQEETPGDAELGTAARTQAARFAADGTDVVVRWQGSSLAVESAAGDSPVRAIFSGGSGWNTTHITPEGGSSLSARRLEFTLTGAEDSPFLLDSITVYDDSTRTRLLLAAGGAGIGLIALGVWVTSRRRAAR